MKIINTKSTSSKFQPDNKAVAYSESEVRNFISERCERALTQNSEYTELLEKFEEACTNNDMDSCRYLSDAIVLTEKNVCCNTVARYMYATLNE